MRRSTVPSLTAAIATGITALLLVGCGQTPSGESLAPDADEQPDSAAAPAQAAGVQGEAILRYDATSFSVSLEFCALSGTDDALFHGAAYDDAGTQVGYLSADFGGLNDSPYGEARLNIGATANLESSDEFLAMGTAVGQLVITDFSDTSLIVVGGLWDQGGVQQGTATLNVTC